MPQPATASPENTVRAAVLRRLLRGEPVDPPSLAAEIRFSTPAVAQALTIASPCAHCSTGITVALREDRVLSSEPESPVVFHVGRDCCEAGPAVLTRCPHINFFCGADHLNRWRSEHPVLAGDVLTLAQAVRRAREIFGPTIDLVRGARDVTSS
jgi:Alkylmercury lyase